LVLLGLNEKNAKYAAYALHGVFSYPTSGKLFPGLDTKLPIHIERMGKTRWGRNWGTFERIDWVDDVEIDKVRVAATRSFPFPRLDADGTVLTKFFV
jgi:hypothetical protein